MWEPVWRLMQCGHRQRAWYRSKGSRFKSLSNLQGWQASGPGGKAGRQTGDQPGAARAKGGNARTVGGLASYSSSGTHVSGGFEQVTPSSLGFISPNCQ